MVRKLVKNDADITDHKEILTELHDFYSNLFSRKIDQIINQRINQSLIVLLFLTH